MAPCHRLILKDTSYGKYYNSWTRTLVLLLTISVNDDSDSQSATNKLKGAILATCFCGSYAALNL